MADSLVRVDRVTKSYGERVLTHVLHGIDLQIRDGERLAVLGPNGAGKTTLMRAISGVIPSVSGRVEIEGEDVTDKGAHDRLERVGWVPEGRLLFSDFTVRDNLMLSARVAGQGAHFDELLAESIDLFPILEEKLPVPAGTLSGGQQQMVAIARALVRRPQLLILDEPSMGLGPLVLEDIREALKRLSAQGLSILITEQNVAWLVGLIDSVAVIGNGQINTRGTAELLEDREALRSIYLGE